MASIGMPLSFIRLSGDPLDVSEVFKTTQERIDYLTNGTRYAGMIVYDYEEDKHYRLSKDKNSWLELQGRSGSESGTKIESYDDTKTYNTNDFCYYNNYIWICDEDNITGVWDNTKWTQIGDKTEVYDLEAIRNLVGLTEEEVTTLSAIIDDSIVTLSTTYSSSKIYTDLQKVLNDSKAFTLSELANIVSASYKVVSTMEGQTDKSIIYLIANASNSYDMYILEDDLSSTKIGTTEISVNLEIDPVTKHWMLDGVDLGVVAEGQDGKTPTITQNAGNTFDVYKLDINDGNGNITTTPNLMAHDEVSVPMNGYFKVYVEDGHLKLMCEDGATPPPFSINEDGHLLYTVGSTIKYIDVQYGVTI